MRMPNLIRGRQTAILIPCKLQSKTRPANANKVHTDYLCCVVTVKHVVLSNQRIDGLDRYKKVDFDSVILSEVKCCFQAIK